MPAHLYARSLLKTTYVALQLYCNIGQQPTALSRVVGCVGLRCPKTGFQTFPVPLGPATDEQGTSLGRGVDCLLAPSPSKGVSSPFLRFHFVKHNGNS